jgi:DNA mismatch repair protein MSH6
MIKLGFSRLSPVDAILTRMGAYDNMFSHSSTFKVELDEWCVVGIADQHSLTPLQL